MSEKEELALRIAKIRSVFCDDNNKDFGAKIGVSEQHASSICTGNKIAGNALLDKILHAFPSVSRTWLKLGEGDMIRSDIQEQVSNTAINNRNSSIIQGREINSNTDIDRLITLLENKDKQIDRLISLLEQKHQHHE